MEPMETITSYEFNVQVWHEDDTWNYSVVQEFENDNDRDVEPLGYGTADTYIEAFHNASEVIKAYLGS
jgi:hypothetical protein